MNQNHTPELIERLDINLKNLSMNIQMTGGYISRAAKEIEQSVNRLDANIVRASESSDKQANSMKWLTVSLICVGILQIFVPLIYSLYFSK